MSRRERLRAESLEPARVAIIERNFPYFARLSPEDQRELLGHVRVFLDEKKFEGCGGLELTDEIETTIAAQACLLLLHRDTDYYPGLDVILVYPSAYRAKGARNGNVVLDEDQVRLGESHRRGVIVLSWDDVKRGAADPDDGHNVVLHEFAHKLDEEDGAADGAPILEHRSSYAPWARILGAEFEALSKATLRGRETDIDPYGATSPAEFFAVVTEEFFEKPETLAKNHPHLYEQLAAYYDQDPLARLGIAFTPPNPDDAPRIETKAKPKRQGALLRRMKNDPTGHVNALRAPLLAIGAEPCGFLETSRGSWGFVSEVYRCPDASVVGATYHFAQYGDGLAFHTMLDNGTIVSTETSQSRPLSFRMMRVVPFNHPREHFFVVSLALAPAELYEAHRARVRRVAERERATPLTRDAWETYAACRLRSVELLDTFMQNRLALQLPVAAVMFVAVALAVARRAEHLNRGAIAVGAFAGLLVVMLFSERVAALLQRRRFRSAPVAPDVLFDRAARLEMKHSE